MDRTVGRGRPVSINTGDRNRLARAVTELLAPANLAVVQLLLVSWHSSPGLAALGWGAAEATFCGLIPYGIVIAGVRRRRWTDRHVRVRQQRPVPFLVAIASFLAGPARNAGRPAAAGRACRRDAHLRLAATLVVTLWWKLSLHTAAASGTVAILVLTSAPRSFWPCQ
jgi:hypothetical protein